MSHTEGAWCLFRYAGRGFAVPLACVAEVVESEHERWAPWPLAGREVLGLTVWRREILPVVRPDDGQAPQSWPARQPLLVLLGSHGACAIPVERNITVVPAESEGGAGGLSHGGVFYRALDLDTFWEDCRARIAAAYEQAGSAAVPMGGDRHA